MLKAAKVWLTVHQEMQMLLCRLEDGQHCRRVIGLSSLGLPDQYLTAQLHDSGQIALQAECRGLKPSLFAPKLTLLISVAGGSLEHISLQLQSLA